MEYYDIHTHLNHEPLSKQADLIAKTCKEEQILLNNIGTNLNTSKIAIDLAKQNINCFACVGIHPNDTSDVDIKIAEQQIKEWLLKHNDNKIVAIGETGLDYHYEHNKKTQFDFLNMHFKLAKQFNLPLMLHVRDAHEDMINFLRQNQKQTHLIKCIIHCFSGNLSQAKQYINLNCYISIPGIITFKNNQTLSEVIKNIPINKILVETDAPWLTPNPYRGSINSPLYIPYIVKKISEVLNQPIDEIKKQLFNNAIQLFNLLDYNQ